ETGKIVWETTFPEIASVVITTAPLAIKDKIIVGAANSGAGIRDWIAALDAATGKRIWLKYTVPAPGEPGSETWKDKNNAWQTGGLITHPARNGFVYTMDRYNGQIVSAKPYMDNINWTKGIDQKTGKPLDYDPGKDIQTYSGIANHTPNEPVKKVCPSILGGNNYWQSSYSQRTKLF